MSVHKYHKKFQALVQVLDNLGCTLPDKVLIEECASGGTIRDSHIQDAKEQTLAMVFIKNSNRDFAAYRDHLKARFLEGTDVYPKTLAKAFSILFRIPND